MKTWNVAIFLVALGFGFASACSRPRGDKVLLISIDGLGSSYLEDYQPLENFQNFLAQGSRATVIPIFPTVTLPCHYSIVTGKYAENHGVVGNSMFDRASGKFFKMENSEVNRASWWTTNATEPIWVTAKRQGLKVGNIAWPAGTVVYNPDLMPDFVVPFNTFRAYKTMNAKFDVALDWFTNKSVDFVALYHPTVDSIGHNFGNYHRAVNKSLQNVDESLGYLIRRVSELGLTDSLNIIFTSDHGMVRIRRRITLESLNISKTDISVVESGAYLSFNVAPEKRNEVLDKLRSHPNLTVYEKQEIPDRLRYKRNALVPDVLAIANEQSLIGFIGDGNFELLGAHGYDNRLESMRAMLWAKGPHFRVNYVATRPYEQVDIYSLLCFLLGLQPQPNDGHLHDIEELVKYSHSSHCPLQANAAASPIASLPTPIVTFFTATFCATVSRLLLHC